MATTTTAGLDPYARAIGAEEFQRADWVESNVLVPLNTVPYDKSRSLKKLLAYLLEMDLISVTTFYSDDDKFNKIGDSSVDCMRGPPIDDD